LTPQQSHQRADIMLKHGQEGWVIYRRLRYAGDGVRRLDECPLWDWVHEDYRAVRIEKTHVRTPLPIEHFKRGMELQLASGAFILVLRDGSAEWPLLCAWGASVGGVELSKVSHWRWPHETEWHPAYTETTEEKWVERLEVES